MIRKSEGEKGLERQEPNLNSKYFLKVVENSSLLKYFEVLQKYLNETQNVKHTSRFGITCKHACKLLLLNVKQKKIKID